MFNVIFIFYFLDDDIQATPDIFASKKVRNRLIYKILSEHDFIPEEKTWLCQYYTHQINLFGSAAPSLTAISCRYKIPRTTFSGWMSIYKAGGKFMESGGQRALDDYAKETLLKKLENNLAESKKDMDERKFIETMQEEVHLVSIF